MALVTVVVLTCLVGSLEDVVLVVALVPSCLEDLAAGLVGLVGVVLDPTSA